MAKSKSGMNGQVRGKVGNLVYSSWKGIDVVKRAPVRTAPFTEKQKLQQWLFKLTQDWLNPISTVLKIGFKAYTETNQGVTAAKSYLFKNALIRDGYNSWVDPSLMLVSYGNLTPAANLAVILKPENELVFTWDTSVSTGQNQLDQVLLLAYNVQEKEAVSSLGGHFRKDGTASLSLLNRKAGEYHLYAAFVAADRSRQSNSVYLGSVPV